MKENKLDLQLVNSTYRIQEASEVLLQLITDKIKFLNKQRFSLRERFGTDTSHLERRMKELDEAKLQLMDFLYSYDHDEYDVEISSPINIRLVKKEERSNMNGHKNGHHIGSEA